MKKFVFRSLALAGLLATPAMAADMPVKARPAPPVCYNWSGVYVGAHAGYLFGEAEWTYVNPFINPVTGVLTPAGSSQTLDLAHWLVGGHFGALLQFGCSPFGNFVIGVEGSLNATHRNSEDGIVDLRFGPPGTGFARATAIAYADLDEYHTAGIRLGWAWDTWLFTVNGGWATANIHTRYIADPAIGVNFDAGRDTHRHNGWYVGAAIENAVVRGPFVDFILGLEYQFLRFEEERHCVVSTAFTCPAAGGGVPLTPANRLGAERDISVDAHTVRVRATIKTPGFGFFFAP